MVYDEVAGEKHQHNNFHCTKLNFRYFWTCHFVKFESKRSFKLRKLHLLKEYDTCKVFLTFVSVDLLHQMTGLSLYVEKLIQTSPHKHTNTHPFSSWEKVRRDKFVSTKQNAEGCG